MFHSSYNKQVWGKRDKIRYAGFVSFYKPFSDSPVVVLYYDFTACYSLRSVLSIVLHNPCIPQHFGFHCTTDIQPVEVDDAGLTHYTNLHDFARQISKDIVFNLCLTN